MIRARSIEFYFSLQAEDAELYGVIVVVAGAEHP
jgi:hypothetical protein